MEPATSAALVGAGAAVFNTAAQGFGNIRSQRKWKERQQYLEQQQIAAEKRQFDYNKQLQDYAYQQNLAQWNRENAYNSPSAQMGRLQSAGLNANLVYGDGAQMAAANSPTMQVGDVGTGSAQVAPYSELPPVANFSEVAGLGIQQMLAKAQVAKMNAETLSTLSDADFKDASFDLRLREIAEGIENTVAGTENLNADTEGKNIANKVENAISDTKIEQAKEDLENTKKQGWNLEKMNALLSKQIEKTSCESALLRAQKKIADLDAKIKKVDADNADVLMDLRKQRENVAIRLANNQAAVLDKDLEYYDQKTRAQLYLSAAETFNRKAFGKLANSRQSYQDYVNKMNEILLDPTKETDAKTYISALLLKNLNETSFLDVIKVLKDSDDDDEKPALEKSDADFSALIDEYKSKMTPEQRNKYEIWLHNTNSATDSQKFEFLKELFK